MKTWVDYAFEIVARLLEIVWIVGLMYMGWRIANLDDNARWAFLYFLLIYIAHYTYRQTEKH